MNNEYKIVEFMILNLLDSLSFFLVFYFASIRFKKSVLRPYNTSNNRTLDSVLNLLRIANHCENLIVRQLQLSV